MTVAITAPSEGWSFRIAFAACSLLLLLPLWSSEFLPMVDLPQHAAQLAMWRHWEDASYGYQELFRTNWFTPYLLGYLFAYAFSWFMPIKTAFTLLVTLAVWSVPVATRQLIREAGGNPWWVFISFPVGFSYAFYWGFLNFLVATPVALFFLWFSLRYARSPSLRQGLLLALLANLMFFSHAMLFGFGSLIAATVIALRSPNIAQAVKRCLPLTAAIPLGVAWFLSTRSAEGMTHIPPKLEYGWHRLWALGGMALGVPPTTVVVLTTLTFLLIPFLLGARFAREPHRWVPLLVTLTLYFTVPFEVMGASFLFPRFSVFLIPTFLYALDRGPDQGIPAWRRSFAPLIACAWLLSLAQRFDGFNDEVDSFGTIAAKMEPGSRVLTLTVVRESAHVPGPVFLHFPTWYQVEHGGIVDFSFAKFFPQVIRYKPGRAPPLPPIFEWQPQAFDWNRHGGHLYDYFVVRAPLDLRQQLFKSASNRVVLDQQSGMWWIYRAAEAASARAAGSTRATETGDGTNEPVP